MCVCRGGGGVGGVWFPHLTCLGRQAQRCEFRQQHLQLYKAPIRVVLAGVSLGQKKSSRFYQVQNTIAKLNDPTIGLKNCMQMHLPAGFKQTGGKLVKTAYMTVWRRLRLASCLMVFPFLEFCFNEYQ